MSEEQILSIRADSEQIEAIRFLFEDNEWFLDVVPSQESVDSESDAAIGDEGDEESGFVIPQDITQNECPQCFCRPCITSEQNRQTRKHQGRGDLKV